MPMNIERTCCTLLSWAKYKKLAIPLFSECTFISVVFLESRFIATVELEQLLALGTIERCEANGTAQLYLLQLTPGFGDSNPIEKSSKSRTVSEHTDAVDKAESVWAHLALWSNDDGGRGDGGEKSKCWELHSLKLMLVMMLVLMFGVAVDCLTWRLMWRVARRP